MMNRHRSIPGRGAPFVGLLLIAALTPACADGQGSGDLDEEAEALSAVWRAEVSSSDPAVRAHGVDLVPAAPGEDGLALLERLAVHDSDDRVREQAVLAYQQLCGREGERFLKDIVLGDASTEVRSAAQAALARLHEEHPTPPRAWLALEPPSRFSPGKPFEVRVRFGSQQEAPEARVFVRAPKRFTGDARELQWKGSLTAGAEREMTFHLTSPAEVMEGTLRVRLDVDYEEALDLEQLEDGARVETDATEGRFQDLPAPPPRVPSLRMEVQP